MQLRTFDVFTKKVDQHYNELVGKIDSATNGIKQNTMTVEAIEAMQSKILNDLYIYPKLVLSKETGSDTTELVSFNLGRQLIQNGFRQSSNESGSTISEISYKLTFSGGEISLMLSEKYHKRSVRGSINGNALTLEYHFQGDDFNANGPQIKAQKDNLLKLLVDNNDDVQRFFEDKKQPFINQIRLKIQERLSYNQKKIDNSKTY